METREYYRLAKIEDFHWWYRAMHRLVIDLCKRLYKGPTLGDLRSDLIRLLDAGCGSGGLTRKLGQFANVVGLDVSPLALSLAKKRKLRLIEGSVNSLPFFDECFDMVVSTSVIYHRLVDEDKAIGEFYRVLKSKGKIILIFSEFFWVYGVHDEAVHTRKRYTLSEVISFVESRGFRVIDNRYIFIFLFPVFVVKRLVEKIIPNRGKISDLEIMPSFLNRFLFWLCRVEWKLGDFLTLPFGSSLLVVGEKK